MLTELGQDLVGVELEKTCLIRPDLVDPDVRITRLGCLRDCCNGLALDRFLAES